MRLVETNQNFKQFVAVMSYFDAILTGARFPIKKKGYFPYVQALMNLGLKKEQKVNFPRFICDCFEAFTKSKKQISLDMDRLYTHVDKRFNDLLFYSIDRDNNKEIKRNDDDLCNVIRPQILYHFPNVKSLIILSTSRRYSFSFSLIAFLSVINGTSLDEIIIESQENHGYNWIKNWWQSDEELLKKAYAAANYQIEMEKIRVDKRDEYHLKINRGRKIE